LKKKFTKKLVLIISDLNKKMRMKVDILNYATERVLFMECENRLWRLVVFFSKFLNKIKRNYEIHDKEILVIIKRLEN